MDLLELTHETDPRYLQAPRFVPEVITLEDLIERKYGKLLVSKVGVVVARYEPNEDEGWTLLPNPPQLAVRVALSIRFTEEPEPKEYLTPQHEAGSFDLAYAHAAVALVNQIFSTLGRLPLNFFEGLHLLSYQNVASDTFRAPNRDNPADAFELHRIVEFTK